MIPDKLKPLVIIAVGAAWSISLLAMGYWQNKAGRTAERVEWQSRDNKELRLANAEIVRLQGEARLAEHKHAGAMTTAAARYEKEKMDEAKKRDRVIAALRADNLRLRDPGASGVQTCVGGTGQADPGPGERDGGTGSDLPRPAAGLLSIRASEFLVGLASECDEVVRQLQTAQEIIRKDREMQVH